MSSPPPSQKGLAPHNESKVVLFIHCLGKLMDLSAYLAGWVTLKPFLQSTIPWDWGSLQPLPGNEGTAAPSSIMEQVAQPSSAPMGHAGCASPGHAQTPGPHISGLCWALLMPWQGTQDCKTNCCQNSVWNECVIVVIPTGSTGSTVCSRV